MQHPILVASMLKSGTHLFRKMLSVLTGLVPFEPEPDQANLQYDDARNIQFMDDCFLSWHFIASPGIQEEIMRKNAKVIFLYRNVGDIIVSLYYHFLTDADRDINRPADFSAFLGGMSERDGLSFIINGINNPPYRWHGSWLFFRQMESFLDLSERFPVCFLPFESLTTFKPQEMTRVADFLGIEITESTLQRIVDETDICFMRNQARQEGREGLHYRKGNIGDNAYHLDGVHWKFLEKNMFDVSPLLPGRLQVKGMDEFLHNRELARYLSHQSLMNTLQELRIGMGKERLKVALFGLSCISEKLLQMLRYYWVDVVAVADTFRHSEMNQVAGIPVISPESLSKYDCDGLVITATLGRNQQAIHDWLRKEGHKKPIVMNPNLPESEWQVWHP